MATHFRGQKLPEGMTLGAPGSDKLPELSLEQVEASGIVDNVDLTKPESEQDDFTKALLNVEYDEDDTPSKLAKACKEKGNTLFKRGEEFYGNALRHWKDAVRHAKKVRKPTAEDVQVHSSVLSNTAAIHFARKQYDKVVEDCEAALVVWPSNVKACFRAARSHLLSKRFAEALEFAQRGLAIEKANSSLKKVAAQAQKQLKAMAAKKAAAERKLAALAKQRQKLRDACSERNIVIGLPMYDAPTSHVADVNMDRDGTMHWPVMFLYDEHGTSDFVAQFSELHTLRQHLEMMLPDDGAPAAWDKDGAYRVSNVEVYYVERATPALPPRLTFLSEGDPAHFECHALAEEDPPNTEDLTWVRVPLDAPLLLALCQPRHVVPRHPVFHVVARGRPYFTAFYERRRGKVVALKLPGE